MGEPKPTPKPVVLLEKNQIKIISGCNHKTTLAESMKGGDLNKDGKIFVEAGKGICKYCPKENQEVNFPEVQANIFWDETQEVKA